MSQRLLLTIVSIGVVIAVALSALVSWGVTSSMIASATIAGPAGADGRDGAPGPRGLRGEDGKDGIDGATSAGTPGKSGPAGAPGASGADGQDATTAPPITVSAGPGSTSLFYGPSSPLATLTVPAGTYALTISLTDFTGTMDYGPIEDVDCSGRTPSGTIVQSATFRADGTTRNIAGSGVASFTAATDVTLHCAAYSFFGTLVATWADATITATSLT